MKRIARIGKQSCINCNWGCAYANGIVVLAEGLDMFRPGDITTAGRMIPLDNLFFAKILWMDICVGVELKRV
jgi:hypothetical protein